MDTNSLYKVSLLDKRWKIIDDMGLNSEKKVAGFHNDDKIGICGTNVILGLIMSSSYLMDMIRCKYDSCPSTFYDEMNSIRNYLEGNCRIRPRTNINMSHIIAHGLCQTYNNKTYNSSYGVSGDYCLFKMYRKKTNSPNPNNLYKELVAEQNIDISSKNRLHMMLNDILSDESSNSYGVGYQYNYYPSLSVLNIQMDGTDVIYNFITPVRFQPNYYEIFGRNVIENLRANVRQWKLNPQVLHMAFSFTDILRIHDRTFLMFAQFLTQLSNNTEQLLNNSQALPEPTFPIYLSIQSVSLPRLTDNNSLLYPFPSINREENDCSFKLKGISVRLMEEGEVSLNTLFPTPQTGTYHRSINDCVRKFRNKMMNFIKDGFDQLEHLVNKYLKTYDYHFEGLCESLIDNPWFFDNLIQKMNRMHTFSVIFKRGIWLAMNDNKAFQIHDIQKFTDMISNEVLDGVLLERVESKLLDSNNEANSKFSTKSI